jgi:hypothetical protein
MIEKLDLAEKERDRVEKAKQMAIEKERAEAAAQEKLDREKLDREKERLENERAGQSKIDADKLAVEKEDAVKKAAASIAVENSRKEFGLVPPSAPSSSPIPMQIVSDAAWQFAKEHLDRAIKVKKETKPLLLKNSDTQNQLMRDKMKINRTVGQLAKSMKQVVPLIKGLESTFADASHISSEYYEVVMYLAAKKIIVSAFQFKSRNKLKGK